MRCFAYSLPCTVNINSVINLLLRKYEVSKLDKVIHFSLPYKNQENEDGNVFIFPYGTLVFWGVEEAIEKEIINSLAGCFVDKLGAEDDDVFSYSYGEEGNKAKISSDHITLPNKHIHTKLAFSHGLSQSVKLGGFENTIQGIIEHTKKLPEDLAKKGKILLSRHQIRKLMGQIFIDRDSINLHLDLLDAPNFFWDKPDLEAIHEMVTKYLDQEKRVGILNQRLSVIQQLLDMLANELNTQHSSKLEWIIIILIFIEILITVAKEILAHSFS